MRPFSKRAGVAAGVAVAVTSAGAFAQAPAPTVKLRVADASVIAGQSVQVSGSASREHAGRSVQLEFAPRGGQWTTIATTALGREGRYRMARPVPRSGALRVTLAPSPDTATAAAASRTAAISVAARVGIRARRLNVRAGRRAVVAGRISPADRGVRVSLQIRSGRRWLSIDRDRTSSAGRFALRDRQRSTKSARVRVVVAPHAGFARSRKPVGRLNVYRVAHASWYGPGFYGQRTGCGGRLGYGQLGVAHKSLPCGTKVTFRHRGRVVRVPVIDRGPYVGNREYDLTEPTARRLGFNGHGAILTTR